MYVLSAALLLLMNCSREKAHDIPDVSDIKVDLDIHRFEKELMDLDTTDWPGSIKLLEEEYPFFFNCFLENIYELPPKDSVTAYVPNMKRLIGFGGFRAAYDSVLLQYPDLDFLKKDLRRAFQFHQYYFPDMPVPGFVTFVSHYQYGVVTCGDSTIGIGLDLFLGSDYTWYPSLNIPGYMTRTMEPAYILPNVTKSYARHHFKKYIPPETQLLEAMIARGKILYFQDLLLPESADHLKIGYTPEGLEWCEEHAGEIWAYFVGKDLLFEDTRLKYLKYVSPGPTTAGMPKEAPGNIGSWVGWQIVRAYMARYENISYIDLLGTDAKKVLERSGYKPPRG